MPHRPAAPVLCTPVLCTPVQLRRPAALRWILLVAVFALLPTVGCSNAPLLKDDLAFEVGAASRDQEHANPIAALFGVLSGFFTPEVHR